MIQHDNIIMLKSSVNVTLFTFVFNFLGKMNRVYVSLTVNIVALSEEPTIATCHQESISFLILCFTHH